MKRGTCPECDYRQSVRKDGTMSRHKLYYGSGDSSYCPGGGRPEKFQAANRAAYISHMARLHEEG